ncbi:MAG: AAA family ATPase [Anaerolineaceae bacterium]|nr:AAA family ATPase [Anaerolineaceae bacterium]
MKIIELNIEGFRSLKSISWKPGDLNLVIGPNGSGKSNLLKGLEMLSASSRGKLAEQVIREGGMEPLVWDGTAQQIEFSIHCSPIDSNRSIERDSLDYELNLSRLGVSSAYRIEHEFFGNVNKFKKGVKPSPLIILERTPASNVVFDDQQQGLTAPSETVPPEESLLSLSAGPYTANRLIPPFQNWLSNWTIYHDFQTFREAPVRQPALARTERQIAQDGRNLVQVLHTLYTTNRDFKRDLNLAMNAAFGDDFEELSFPPDVDQRVQLKLSWKSLKRSQSTSDLSDGTLRFLYLVAILANPNPPPLVAIDEPETGLHPSMLPIIAEYARNASIRSQVIITTHSAELLDAFSEYEPIVTTAKWTDGKTNFSVLSGESLQYWLKEYTLGKLYRSGELEELS